jgi:hypothetical protein
MSIDNAEETKEFSDVELHAKFERPASDALSAAPLDVQRGYGTITYRIGERRERDYLTRAITAFTDTLPPKFGNSEGSYTITIVVKDVADKELAKAPIFTFQWKNQRVLFFIDKVIDQIKSTDWSGTLVSKLLATDSTSRLSIGVEVTQSSARSMDFDSLIQISKLFSEGAMAAFLPLPAAATGIITAVGDLVNLFYAGSRKASLVDAEEFPLTSESTDYDAPVRFRDSQGRPWTLPIKFTVSSLQSRYMSGPFRPENVTVAMTDDKAFTIVTAKGVAIKASLIELLRSSDAYQDIRGLLDQLAAGKPYQEPDLGVRCASLYGAFGNYLSIYDARALFWAFVKKYSGLVDPQVCLSGGRREELQQIGLTV